MARPPYRRKASAFVAHLYEMMTKPKLAPYCGFVPDGKSFYVTHSKEFLDTVLPQVLRYMTATEFILKMIACMLGAARSRQSMIMNKCLKIPEVSFFTCPYLSLCRSCLFRLEVLQAQSHAIFPPPVEPVLVCQAAYRYNFHELQPSTLLARSEGSFEASTAPRTRGARRDCRVIRRRSLFKK